MNQEEEKEEGEKVRSEEMKCLKCEEYLFGWKRALADYDNLKKDLIKEKDDMRRGVKEDMAESIIPILDHFDQALKFKPQNLDATLENWLTGMMHVRNQLESVLLDMGVTPFGAIGDTFDPHLHESVGEREDENAAEHSVVEVSLRGWKLGEKVIRPATVVVRT
ncbi:nucleotide exchange factor GrpE [Candidatus Uhrbacteria bacterium RIFCSPLOWO2_02_FULL_48_18]|uniref:Protein GrpE n=1 Tax=Candidatus Uhrbacteria bacterium RIFCSPLOWO2_02_FULL_48_18 TaxID=1802408 RepID=A0A1F7V9T2_9BACT|nr:MAG: nucleotide exchange factor GrpE [Candidatus Uhrbacteria bacterium RIFCSPHIGHO2_01_FULL_47_10]OGL82274.1 MAG: nucleotide exchange factor GrpE [Candidatus Uhrbacteria bacterium RIFCSPLOWO2_01_FULL_47_17]OGL86858.1 MAG: nucleotide exchange factor GrpE [Candidatus Uhrbacteria bacterium RIFCSPLOWO2_02_FULL_48_18]OGL94130.1 MAG: nucleotide exchange factor GrpE [Candidatus Uhrbacteria bacterium RIFCSPLOWO2_12_FULL_47_9]